MNTMEASRKPYKRPFLTSRSPNGYKVCPSLAYEGRSRTLTPLPTTNQEGDKKPGGFWKDENNCRAFFDDFAKEAGFDPLSVDSWYALDLSRLWGKKVLTYFGSSHRGQLTYDLGKQVHFWELWQFHVCNKKRIPRADLQIWLDARWGTTCSKTKPLTNPNRKETARILARPEKLSSLLWRLCERKRVRPFG